MNKVNCQEEIVKVARDLFERSGQVEGHDLDNWLEAEKIVIARYREQEKDATKETVAGKKTTTKGSITKRSATKKKKTTS